MIDFAHLQPSFHIPHRFSIVLICQITHLHQTPAIFLQNPKTPPSSGSRESLVPHSHDVSAEVEDALWWFVDGKEIFLSMPTREQLAVFLPLQWPPHQPTIKKTEQTHFWQKIIKIVRHRVDRIFVGEENSSTRLKITPKQREYTQFVKDLNNTYTRRPTRQLLLLFLCEHDLFSLPYMISEALELRRFVLSVVVSFSTSVVSSPASAAL